jgi:hypothetical protein
VEQIPEFLTKASHPVDQFSRYQYSLHIFAYSLHIFASKQSA